MSKECDCHPCPGRGNDGHGLTHCAECCFGTGIEADIACPIHGMTEQLTLDITPLSTEPIPADLTIQERFVAFHEANPWVLQTLERLTRQWLTAGHQKVGIGMLFEIIRWEYSLATHGESFKLNNNLRSRYARRLVEDHPEWQDAFETRRLRAA